MGRGRIPGPLRGPIRDPRWSKQTRTSSGGRPSPFIETRGPLGTGSVSPRALCGPDGADEVIAFITKEMNSNVKSRDADVMRKLWRADSNACFTPGDWAEQPEWRDRLRGMVSQLSSGWAFSSCLQAVMDAHELALLLWTGKVMTNGDWDHKPKIAASFGYSGERYAEGLYHQLGRYLVYFDIWSNIHYGYVANFIGFPRDMMLDGAGLEQLGDQVRKAVATLGQKWQEPWLPPRGDLPPWPLRNWDDQSDRTSIELGYRLYDSFPGSVTASAVRHTVLAHIDRLRNRPLPDDWL